MPDDGKPLAFAAHLGAHVLSDDEVVLLSERDRFALRGRVHAALTPLLDGSRSADELAAALAATHPPAHVHLALLRLRRQGWVVEPPESVAVPDADPPGVPSLPGSHVSMPARSLREVSAVGVPATWARRLGDAVATNGRPGTPLRVLLVDDYLRPELAATAASLKDDEALLLVRPVGRWLWFGPLLLGRASHPTWRLLDERLRMNRFADVTALERGATLPLFADDRSPATVERALSIARELVAGVVAGTPASALLDGLLTYDTVEARFDHHPLERVAAEPRPDAAAAPAIELRDAPARFAADGGHRTCSPAETLARLERFVSPITGIVSAVEAVPGVGGAHVFAAVHPQAPVVTRPAGRTLGRKGGAMGKGFDPDQARVSCIGEAIERYSGGFFGDEPRRRERFDAIEGIALHPDELLLFSTAQYATRTSSGDAQAADAVPARFDASQAIDWVPLTSLVSGEIRWLPAAYCYYGYGVSDVSGYDGDPYCVADSNGCAAGNTLEEAILQALMELIERDACALAWYTRTRRPEIDVDGFDGAPFSAVREGFAARGKQLAVLDLRTDTQVPVAMAVAWNRDDGLGTTFALGCHLDPRIAVSRALSELAQLEADEPDPAASIDDVPHLRPSDAAPVRAGDLPVLTRPDIAEEIRWCCDLLAGLGHDVLVLDQTRPEVGFPTVRVVVPGLRHFWRRLAPGRLYDTPVKLGWLDAPPREDELNPVPVLI